MIIEPASRAELEPVIAAGQGLTACVAETMTPGPAQPPGHDRPQDAAGDAEDRNDHIKAIFATAGVSSRGDLMATVSRDHSMPGL